MSDFTCDGTCHPSQEHHDRDHLPIGQMVGYAALRPFDPADHPSNPRHRPMTDQPATPDAGVFDFDRKHETDTLTLREVIRYGKGYPYIREWHAQMSMGAEAVNVYADTPEAALDALRKAIADLVR